MKRHIAYEVKILIVLSVVALCLVVVNIFLNVRDQVTLRVVAPQKNASA